MPELEEMSKVHRVMAEDRVAYTTDGNENLEVGAEGTVTGFDNEERTYLVVDWDNDYSSVVTEDEVRRLG